MSILVARFLTKVYAKELKIFFRELFYFAIGAFPILLIIIFFKIKYAPQNDLLSPQEPNRILEKLTTISRYLQIGKAFVLKLYEMERIFIVVIPIYFLLTGVKRRLGDKSICINFLIVFSLALASYFFVYLITPYDLNWHIEASLQRLLIQLWPATLFILFLIVSPLEEETRRKNALSSLTIDTQCRCF